MNIVLIGFMGTGKTVVGRILAQKLGWGFFDTDAMLEAEVGATIPQIFKKAGEGAFRDFEAKAVALVAALDRSVIATGGGVPLSKNNMKVLKKNGAIVCLTASPETILERLGDNVDSRPLLAGRDPLLAVEKLLDERRSAYDRATYTVPTDGRAPAQVAEDILAILPEKMKRS